MNFLKFFLSLCTLFTFLSVCLFVCIFLHHNFTTKQKLQIKKQTTTKQQKEEEEEEGYLL